MLTVRSAAQRFGGDGCRLTADSVRCDRLRTPDETSRDASRGAPLPRYLSCVPLVRCRHDRPTCDRHAQTFEKDGPRDHQHGRAGRSYATARGSRSGRCARCGASARTATAIFLTIPGRVSARCSHGEGGPLRRSAPRKRRVASPSSGGSFFRCGMLPRDDGVSKRDGLTGCRVRATFFFLQTDTDERWLARAALRRQRSGSIIGV